MHIFRSHPQISDSVGLQEGLRLCIFNEFSQMIWMLLVSRPHFEKSLLNLNKNRKFIFLTGKQSSQD